MDTAQRIGPDLLRVPMRAEGPGGIIGDGVADIGPDHPLYAQWAQLIDGDGGAPVQLSRPGVARRA